MKQAFRPVFLIFKLHAISYKKKKNLRTYATGYDEIIYDSYILRFTNEKKSPRKIHMKYPTNQS